MAKTKKRGKATSFVCKRRVRRFIAEENLMPLRRGVPGTLWPLLDAVVQSKIREELARGQIALPL